MYILCRTFDVKFRICGYWLDKICPLGHGRVQKVFQRRRGAKPATPNKSTIFFGATEAKKSAFRDVAKTEY